MAATITPVSRISRILGINNSQVEQEKTEDWYIPYHGPYEPPKNDSRTSVSSGKSSVTGSMADHDRQRGRRKRVLSTTSTKTATRPPTGGIGDTPIPRRRQSVNNLTSRLSLASFLSFSTSSKKQTPTQIQKSLSRPSIFTLRDQDPFTSNTQSEDTRLLPIPRHPYAMVYSKPEPEPVTPDYFPSSKGKERVAFARQDIDIPLHLKPPSRPSLLKTSISTPDLRSPSLSRGRRHWLSAETWCDALLFPLPRFTVKHIGEDGAVIDWKPTDYNGPRRRRTLTKAKSVTELRTLNYNAIVPTRRIRTENEGTSGPGSKYLRPKSFALDDISIPSTAPSITRVLADAEILDHERSAWRKQASRSPFNKRSRSLSRARIKSHNNKTRLPVIPDTGTFDFLVARTLLGSQSVAPVIHRTLPSNQAGLSSNGPSSGHSRSRSKSHGHSMSVGTMSDKPEKTGSTHKRAGSFGSVLKRAKTTTAAASGTDPITQAGKSEALGDLEKALRSQTTKIISLSDWTRHQSPLYGSGGVDGNSPTPSALTTSAEGVGIAFSFTPSEGHSQLTYEEPIRMPSHPYAQGGAYSHSPAVSVSHSTHDTEPNNPHRQPVVHPYPTYSYLSPVLRQSGISPAKRMFAEIPTGVIQEILPDEIQQYSPFSAEVPKWPSNESGSTNNHEVRRDGTLKRISSTLNMGEALGMDMSDRGTPESGLGGSENHPFGPSSITVIPRTNPPEEKKRVQRRPVDPPKLEFDDPTVLFPLPRRNPSVASPQNSQLGLPKSTTNDSNPVSGQTPSSGNVNPLCFSNVIVPPGRESSESPPEKSRDSSLYTSPRPIDRLDDFEKYQDLFYKPDSPSQIQPRSPSVRHQSNMEVEPKYLDDLDVNRDSQAQTDKSLSGMTWIAREMSELDVHEDDSDVGAADMSVETEKDEIVMVGRRFVGLKGPRPMNSKFYPALVLSSRDRSPEQKIPEDAVQASESEEDHIISEHGSSEDVRFGLVETVTTPPPTRSMHHRSSEVQVAHIESEPKSSSLPDDPISPSTGVTRSSYMTGGSGTDTTHISGLSDFPRPPSGAVSVIASYYLNSPPHLPQSTDEVLEENLEENLKQNLEENLEDLEETLEDSDGEAVAGVRDDTGVVRLQSSRTTFGGDVASDFRTDVVRML